MSAHRLFRFPKPAWLNNANTRTAGVYTAGALVGSLFILSLPILTVSKGGIEYTANTKIM
jgi:hypothetical protein